MSLLGGYAEVGVEYYTGVVGTLDRISFPRQPEAREMDQREREKERGALARWPEKYIERESSS